jgi:hypothetical protein
VGREVHLSVKAEVPPGTGSIVALEWDFDGTGRFPVRETVEPAEAIVVDRPWSAPEPGTYFPVVRVVAQRHGDAASAYARLRNLARVRVVANDR